MTASERKALLEVLGPLTVKEVEDLIFHSARSDPQFEASQRTWLEADRSYFVRWRSEASAPLQVIGLVHAYQLPEMASRVEVLAFEDDPEPDLRAALGKYIDLLGNELADHDFFA
ncbi:MAG: hypothetical protein JOZ39_12320 [Chloroflexi bacterium]|nr:hypothetical protein [Chloroflexota bacterium]